jgi:hypothetical protein
VTFLLFLGNAVQKFEIYKNLIIAVFMIIGIYHYALYNNTFYFKYYIYTFIIISFFISFLEVKFNFILPGSVKEIDQYYNISFKNIPMSTFYNANDFAAAIGMLFIYIYSYCNILRYTFRYFILLCCFFIIYFTGSRGIQLSVFLFPLIYSFVNKRPVKRLIIYYVILIMIIIFLFTNNILSVYSMDKYLNTVSSINAGKIDSSSLLRLQMIIYTFKNVKKLIIGFGPGGSSLFLSQFVIPNPHNFFVEILIDYGIIGIILVLGIFGLSLKKNYDLLKKNISYNLKASCKATIILFYLFILFSAVPSSLLNYWPYAWLPVYLTLINMGAYKRQRRKSSHFYAGKVL